MVEIRKALPTEWFDAISSLIEEHWMETESHLVPTGPNPIIAAYKAMEDADCIVSYAAFDGDAMVGYAVAFVMPHLHYGVTYANHDVLFVKKEYRRGSLAFRLMRCVEEDAIKRGAGFMLWHAKPGTPFEAMLQRLPVEESVYRKEFS